MKILYPLVAVALLTACGQSPSTDSTETTKTTTTVTTTATPAPAVPIPAPSILTQANLDRIQDDMSPAEVEAILGQPTSSSSEPIPLVGGTQTTYNYQSGTSAVTIIFKNNQMKQKSGTFNP